MLKNKLPKKAIPCPLPKLTKVGNYGGESEEEGEGKKEKEKGEEMKRARNYFETLAQLKNKRDEY
jgi:hypothetical protein